MNKGLNTISNRFLKKCSDSPGPILPSALNSIFSGFKQEREAEIVTMFIVFHLLLGHLKRIPVIKDTRTRLWIRCSCSLETRQTWCGVWLAGEIKLWIKL